MGDYFGIVVVIAALIVLLHIWIVGPPKVDIIVDGVLYENVNYSIDGNFIVITKRDPYEKICISYEKIQIVEE